MGDVTAVARSLGLSDGAFAAQLFLSPLTVKTHVSRAMLKLGARDRAQLVVIAYQSGLVAPGDSPQTCATPPGVGRPRAYSDCGSQQTTRGRRHQRGTSGA